MRSMNTLARYLAFTLTLSGAWVASPGQQPLRPAQATIIFTGTVMQLHATTFAPPDTMIPASDRTIVVRVDKVLKSTPEVAWLQGNTITLEAKDPSTFRVGMRGTFFTTGGRWGDGVELLEIAHYEDGTPVPKFRTRQEDADAALAKRLAQVDLVISGTVSSTAPLPYIQHVISEHMPDWCLATIEVETVEKGNLTRKTVTVMFAASTDVAQYNRPKLKPGDHAIWLLHTQVPDMWGNTVPRLAATDPLDSQPITELAKVRALLKSGSTK